MAITTDDFNKVWASTSPLTPYSFSESQYKEGWNFIGGTPPSRQMWDFLQKNNDEKMQYLLNNFDNYLLLSGGTVTGGLTVEGTITGNLAGNATNATNATNDANGNPIAGTYLPLSGGTMTGTIITTANPGLKLRDNDSRLVLCGAPSCEQGAHILLNGKNRLNNEGTFGIVANNGSSGGYVSLTGKPDGTLTWNNKEIERVSAKGTYGIRLESGIQICWGELTIPAGTADREVSGTMTFQYPFANANYVLTFGNDWCASSNEYYRSEGRNTANFKFTAVGVGKNPHSAFYLAIGYWK